MEKELNKKMKENNYDIAISNHQDVVMDNEITRSTSGFTGTELPRESSVEYKTFPNLTMGRTHRSVRLDGLIAAPQNLEMAHA
tara:strand:+ start:286 stop:534 length:249 start_codon:yes stop_codon:yes gene_type:complete